MIAAGGIADGRGIAAAFALGAAAAHIGTAFLTCTESLFPAGAKTASRNQDGHHQHLRMRTRPGTRGRLVDELGPISSEAPSYPLAGAAAMPLL